MCVCVCMCVNLTSCVCVCMSVCTCVHREGWVIKLGSYIGQGEKFLD